ncbi:phosphorylase family protein [Sorangium sp. So ce854]|uniref:5'-methylthioadenosine/S-adenosylhomocysteine nucleosidase family protein n=1 Tax=Sorangium sp. So ce854 TaxID=3133322 RepID=UPI003F61F67A
MHLSGFDTSEVDDPERLFGHNRAGALLEHLCTELRLGTNCQVVGERRTGKSSLLHCCARWLSQQHPDIVPVYLNFREHAPITGMASAYQYITAAVHAAAVGRGYEHLQQEIRLGDVRLVASARPLDVYHGMGELGGMDAQQILGEEVQQLAGHNISTVLLIDEYEHFLRQTLSGNDTGFFPIRNISMRFGRRFTFTIAGALTWNQLCDALGSPQLNAISSLHYLEPLAPEPFEAMWRSCLDDSTVDARRRASGTAVEDVYALSGGWPFYGKLIGQHLASGGSLDSIRNIAWLHFSVTLNRRHVAAERSILLAAANGLLTRDGATVREMIHRGLLQRDDDGFISPRGHLWAEYLREQEMESGAPTPIGFRGAARTSPASPVAPNAAAAADPIVGQVLAQRADDVVDLMTDIHARTCAVDGPRRSRHVHYAVYDALRSPARTGADLVRFARALDDEVLEVISSVARADPHRYRTLCALEEQFRLGWAARGTEESFAAAMQAVYQEAPRHDAARAPGVPPLVGVQLALLGEALDGLRAVKSSLGDARGTPPEEARLPAPGTVARSRPPERVEVGIITIREDEFGAVLKRFPKEGDLVESRRYSLCRLALASGRSIRVAAMRCAAQGVGEAQNAASDFIRDLDPDWLIVVGIAGGIPSDEFTLGDVVASTSVYDFTVESVSRQDGREFAVAGGPMHKDVAALVAHLPAMAKELGNWHDQRSIGIARPSPELGPKAHFYGDPKWKTRVRSSLLHHFGANAAPRDPRVVSGAIASSDRLIKDDELLTVWLKMARMVIAMEMELAGVYRAARSASPEKRVMAIRGISDIVGFRRSAKWTTYACETAAAFTHALVRSGAMF